MGDGNDLLAEGRVLWDVASAATRTPYHLPPFRAELFSFFEVAGAVADLKLLEASTSGLRVSVGCPNKGH